MNTDQVAVPKLTIIVPCYNEEGNIYAFYDRLITVVNKYDYCILFVDDGSTDKTLSQIKLLFKKDKHVRFISLSRNFGHQVALKAGLDYAREANCVVCMDADLQHPPEIIDSMIVKWKEGFDIVNGVRKNNGKISIVKKTLSRLFYFVINQLSKQTLTLNSPDFRLMDNKVIIALSEFRENAFFLRGLIPWIGYKQCSVNFAVGSRHYGSSKYSLRKQFSLSLRGIVAASITPLRFAVILGCIFSALSFMYGFYALYKYLFTEDAIEGWTSVIASVLFIAGLQFFLLGIIGEYIGKSFVELRQRPLYLVDDTNCEELKY